MLVAVESVEQVLKETLEEADLSEVLILGYTSSGKFYLRSSFLTNKDALYLLEVAKTRTLPSPIDFH